jgi:VWFA-related protein
MRNQTRWMAVAALATVTASTSSSLPVSVAASAAPAVQAATARSPLDPGVGAFAESVEVTVVNIDVVVRDRSGEQVPGLTRDDFALFVDGKKVAITNFSGPAAAARPASGPASGHSPRRPPGLPPEAPGAAAGISDRQRLYLVVCVDSTDLQPFERNRRLEQVRRFVRQSLLPDDQVMLVTFELGFHVRHPFRKSSSALGPELDEMARSISPAQVGAGLPSGDSEYLYLGLERLLRSLGGLDGRKVLFYVGNGWPVSNSLAALRHVIAEANANLVTLYTFEASGLSVHASAENPLPDSSVEVEQLIRWGRQDSLFSMASETGGRAALNGNDFTHDFEEIAAELGTSYSLGFAPSHPGDGKIHEIRVEVDRPGARASYRTSYREQTPDERLEGEVEAALVHGFATNRLGAVVELGGVAPASHGRVLVSVKISVPLGKLAFVPRADGRNGQVSIFAGDLDARGDRAPIQRVQVPLRFAEADFEKALASPFAWQVNLLVEPGRQRLAVAIRDDVAHVSSSLIEEIDVDKNGAASTAVPRAAPPGSP